MTTNPAGFLIAPDWFTGLLRDLVAEGKWSRALKLAVDNLEGLTWGDAVDVCSGAKRFAGEPNRFELADEDPADPIVAAYRERLAWTYGDRFSRSDHWYRPYSIILSYDGHDAKYAHDTVGARRPRVLDGGNSVAWGRARAMYYARDPMVDLVETIHFDAQLPGVDVCFGPAAHGAGYEHAVLFERCDCPPPWLAPPTGPQQAVEACLGMRKTLERVGAQSMRKIAATATEAAEQITDELTTLTRSMIRGGPNPGPSAILEQTADIKALRDAAREAREIAREFPDEEAAAEEAEAERAEIAKLEKLSAEVRERAAAQGGFIKLILAGVEYDVPRDPFHCWALWRTAGRHLMPAWPPICPPGLRMVVDDQYHSDWLIGAGVECFRRYNTHEQRASNPGTMSDDAHRAMFDLQRELLGFTCAVLCGTGYVSGPVIHPKPDEEVPPGSICVVPNADPEYAIPAMSAGRMGCVIVGTGGELAHLAAIGREDSPRIVCVEDCVARYPVGTLVRVDLDLGTVEIVETALYDLFNQPLE